jgi:hypothetical protein
LREADHAGFDVVRGDVLEGTCHGHSKQIAAVEGGATEVNTAHFLDCITSSSPLVAPPSMAAFFERVDTRLLREIHSPACTHLIDNYSARLTLAIILR